MVVGAAYQRGLLPQTAASIERAIELNGVAVDTNVAAFRLGREIGADPSRARRADGRRPPPLTATASRLITESGVDVDDELSEVLAWRVPELVAYQDVAYARRYLDVVARAAGADCCWADPIAGFETSAAAPTAAPFRNRRRST